MIHLFSWRILFYFHIFFIFYGCLCEAEDEEVFEEIRRLRLERGRLLQKIKTFEQQQQTAVSAMEEVLHCRQLIFPFLFMSNQNVSRFIQNCSFIRTLGVRLYQRCIMCVCVCVRTLVVPTKAASRAGRGREGQAAWGAEGTPWYRGQWLWRHGWNVGLPRYAICVNVHVLPRPYRACMLCHACVAVIPHGHLLLQRFLYCMCL